MRGTLSVRSGSAELEKNERGGSSLRFLRGGRHRRRKPRQGLETQRSQPPTQKMWNSEMRTQSVHRHQCQDGAWGFLGARKPV